MNRVDELTERVDTEKIMREFEDFHLQHLICGPGRSAMANARQGQPPRYELNVLPEMQWTSPRIAEAMKETYQRFFTIPSMEFCGHIWPVATAPGDTENAFTLAHELLTHASSAITHLHTLERIESLEMKMRQLLVGLLQQAHEASAQGEMEDWDITKYRVVSFNPMPPADHSEPPRYAEVAPLDPAPNEKKKEPATPLGRRALESIEARLRRWSNMFADYIEQVVIEYKATIGGLRLCMRDMRQGLSKVLKKKNKPLS